MKLRLALALAATFALSGCTDADWSHTMNFIGIDEGAQPATVKRPVARATARPAPQTAPPQTAQATAVNPFCASVAKQDSEGSDFDAATQQGVFVRSYQQCVAIFGNAKPQ
jgi:hypothetical protein